ncbi:RdgB/HAM1 family non-canonical purine NTP pyrophosphatase [Candidatus Omnitrophota bacterium]
MSGKQKRIELVVASRNYKKFKEIKEILREFKLKITSLRDYPQAPRIVENGRTFEENAIKKARLIARFTGKLTLGEDSGLEVAALGGKPGIYSSRFSGRDKNDVKNNLKLLRLLADLPIKERKARYVCSVALFDKHGLLGVTEGYCQGIIAFQLRGSSGFGYDPLFIIPKYKKTFAQLGPRIKHKISHRFRALSMARQIIKKYSGIPNGLTKI